MLRFQSYIAEKALSTAKSAGNFIATDKGAGMTAKGVKAFRARNPGSKLKTAVTGKVKPGSKDAGRQANVVKPLAEDGNVKWLRQID